MPLHVSHLSTQRSPLRAGQASPANSGDAGFALRDIDFTLNPGERLAVVGANGSGKSTLLRALLGLAEIERGTVFFDDATGAPLGCACQAGHTARRSCGQDCAAGKDKAVSFPGTGMGKDAAHLGDTLSPLVDFAYVQQDPEAGFVCTSVFEEVAFGLRNLGLRPQQIETRVAQVLQACGIENLSARKVSELSGGQKQLVSIASALALRPRVLLLDEAFCMLDARSASMARKALCGASDASMAVIEVTHDLGDVLEFDTLIALQRGAIVWRGAPKALAANDDLMRSLGIRSAVDGASVPLVPAGDSVLTAERGAAATDCLVMRDCFFSYEAQDILQGASLHVNPGELVALLGDSGSGKTTCACIAAGLLAPLPGEVLCAGKRVCPGDVGIAFQRVHDQVFKPTVLDDVMFGPLQKGRLPQDARAAAQFALETAGLDPSAFGPLNPHLLSGGEQRRVALAGVLAMQTTFVILDEPTLGLDRFGVERLLSAVRSMLDQGRGVLVITHESQVFAGLLGRAYKIEKGKTVRLEAPMARLSQRRASMEAPDALPQETYAYGAGDVSDTCANASKLRAQKAIADCGGGSCGMGNCSWTLLDTRQPPDESVDPSRLCLGHDEVVRPLPSGRPCPQGTSSLNPIAWLMICAVCSVCALGIDAPVGVVAAWALALGVYRHVGGSLRRLGKALAALSLMYALVIVSAALVFDGGADVLFFGAVGLSWAGAARGVLTVSRLMLLVVVSLALVRACTSEELMDALEAILAPLRRLGMPVADVCVMLTLALRCIPLTGEKVASIAMAQNARGARVGLSSNPIRKVLSYVPLLAPACIAMFRYAEGFAVALQSKGFTGACPTLLHHRAMTPRDWATGIAVCVCAVAAALFL